MSLPSLNLSNQYGEVSANSVLASSEFTTYPKTAVTAIAAVPTPVTAITIATAMALSTGDMYTDAAVNAAVDTAVDAAVNGALSTVVADLQTLVTKINALLVALKS